jgi:hypothetical protein
MEGREFRTPLSRAFIFVAQIGRIAGNLKEKKRTARREDRS